MAQLNLEKFKTMFNCKYCSNLIDNPITLPCGESVCIIHQNEIIQNECKFCDAKHHIENGFQVNRVLNDMLEMEINKIKFSPKYDACKEAIEEVKNNLNEIDQIKNDPENFLYEYFAEIKRKEDIRRED